VAIDFKEIASRTLPSVEDIYLLSKKRVDQLLRENGSSLVELLHKGRIEHAIFMEYVTCRNIIYKDSIPKGEEDLLRAYLLSNRYGENPRDDQQISLTVKDLREYTSLTRKWAWSLKQSVTPTRGKVLEKVVRLATQDALKDILTFTKGSVTVQDTTGDKGKEHVDSTIVYGSSPSKITRLGLCIKGNIRERKDEAVDTRRKALKRGEVQDVWHIFLSDGDSGDVSAFQEMDPITEGVVYTWSGLALKINKSGIKSLSNLPNDVIAFVKP
jgi:hypothetical protein